MTLRRAAAVLAPAALAAALWWAAAPAGDFPVNDDWAYADSARVLAGEGRLRLSDWATPFDLPPIVLGAAFSRLFGFSHTVLRLTTLLWAVAGLWVMWRWLAWEKVSLSGRLLACGTLLFCPLFFVLSFTFHTDVPFLTLCLCAVYAFRRLDEGGDERWALAGGAAAALALLTRQTGLAILMGALLWDALQGRLSPRRFLVLCAPTVVLGGAFLAWFLAAHGPTWAFVNYLVGGTAAHASRGDLFTGLAARVLDASLWAALFAAPCAPAPHRRRAAAALLLGAPIALYVRAQGGLPMTGNFLHPWGLGHLTGYWTAAKPVIPAWSSPLTWAAAAVAGVFSLAFFLSGARGACAPRASRHFICLWAPVAVAALAGEKVFDRYFLTWVPLLVAPPALAGLSVGAGRLALLALWAWVSAAGTRDYLAWNRAKWALGRRALASGFSAQEVANGVDWAGWHYYNARMAAFRRQKPLREIGEMDWKRNPPPKVFISFHPRLEGRRPVDAERFRSPAALPAAALFAFETEFSDKLYHRRGSKPPEPR